MRDGFIQEIRTRGYWRLNLQPVALESLSLGRCKKLIQENSVSLRGWSFPHFPLRNDEDAGLELRNTYYEGWVRWNRYREFWRMYQSGQFLHYMGLREDWVGESRWPPMKRIGIIGSITYQLTEMLEFLSRLAQDGLYDAGVRLSVTLKNTQGRELWIEDEARGSFYESYKTQSPEIVFERDLTKDEAMEESVAVAQVAILQIFDKFGWHDAPIEQVQHDQKALLTGRS